MSTHRIVIVGGGFGGIKAALELSKDSRFDIVLVNDHADFRFYPTIFQVSLGAPKRLASIPLTEVLKDTRVQIVQSSAVDIDRTKRTVTTHSGTIIAYDGLILGLGVKTNFFHIQGLEEYSYGIKTIMDAEELKHHLHNQMIDDRRPDLNYVVIGGGPTGVELAGSLPAYLNHIQEQHGIRRRAIHVDVVEAAPRILPRMPKDMSMMVARRLRKLGVKIRTKTAVQAQTADTLMANGKPIRSHTVIWTAGVMNHPFFAEHGFQLAKNGRVRVDQFLQAEPGIYVIGDNADTPYGGLAQTALHDGAFVAHNLIRLADNKEPKPYHAKKPIYVYPVGAYWAAVLWGNIRIYGILGYFLRRAADLVAFHDYEPWQLAAKRWAAESVEEEECPLCDPLPYDD